MFNSIFPSLVCHRFDIPERLDLESFIERGWQETGHKQIFCDCVLILLFLSSKTMEALRQAIDNRVLSEITLEQLPLSTTFSPYTTNQLHTTCNSIQNTPRVSSEHIECHGGVYRFRLFFFPIGLFNTYKIVS